MGIYEVRVGPWLKLKSKGHSQRFAHPWNAAPIDSTRWRLTPSLSVLRRTRTAMTGAPPSPFT
jgi:hypothetical protein